MNKLALNNINSLLDINDNTEFMFENNKIILDKKSNNLDYGLYFTFHEIFNIITTTSVNRNTLIININNVLNNLYDNNQFINLIDNNDDFKNIMDDICDKTDILTEKYMNKNMCSVFMDELCNRCIIYSKTVVNAYNRIRKPISVEPSISDESSSDDEVDGFIKEE